MEAEVKKKLSELRAEFRAGQAMLDDLEKRKEQVKETLLRISGAIQALEELMPEAEPASVPENGRRE